MPLPVLSGKDIILRQLRRSDAVAIARHANDRHVARFIPHLPFPYSLQDAKSWIDKTHRLKKKGSGYHYGVCAKGSGDILGLIGLRNINRRDQNAEVGYWIARRYWNHGYASEALALILSFAFRTLRLRRVYAIVPRQNAASVKVLEKTGFTREAVWRKACRSGNRWDDVFSYGMLKEEFRITI